METKNGQDKLKVTKVTGNDLNYNKIRESFLKQSFDIDGIDDPEIKAEIENNFYVQPDTHLFLYLRDKLVGAASITFRNIQLENQNIKIAGFGGLAIAKQHRGKGYAKLIIQKRLDVAKNEAADIAFLNTDIKKLGELFEKFGFKKIPSSYSFISKSGNRVKENDGMIAPVNSQKIFDKIMNSDKPLFIGKSNI